MAINKDAFLALCKRELKTTTVVIDGNEFRLREMSEAEGAEYELSLQDDKGKIDFSGARRKMLSLMLVDDDGNRLVDNADDLKSLSRSIAGQLFDAAQKLNSYQPNEVDSLVKN